MEDPAYVAVVDRDLGTGEHLPPQHDRYFTEAYFHHPEEIGAELDEVIALADRIAVMYRGAIIDIVPADTPREKLGRLMAGVTE